jgi:hypothetical protein
MVDEITAEAGISHGTCHKILSDDLNVSHVTQHSVPCVLMQDQLDDRISICGDLIESAYKDGMFLNRIITGVETWCFQYNPQVKRQSATWKSPSLPRKKKPRQDRSEGRVFQLIWNCSHGIHPRRSYCKQAPLQGNLWHLCSQVVINILRFDAGRTGCCYMTSALHIALCLSKRIWQNNRSLFCHTLHTHLISHHAIYFSFPT